MARRKKAPIVIHIEAAPRRTGHYNYRGGNCTFASGPRKLRTRTAQRQRAIRDAS